MINQQQLIWTPGVTLKQAEKKIIQMAFQAFGGNKTATASALGISVRTLYEKMEDYAREESDQRKRDADIAERERLFNYRQRGIKPPESGEESALSPTFGERTAVARPRTQGATPKAQGADEVYAHAGSRVDVQPATATSAELPVSMPVRDQVQKVSSRKTSRARNRKAG